MGSESFGGCFTLLNLPRAMSMGRTSLLKAPNTSASRDRNAKAMMGLPHASVDHSHLTPTSKPIFCAGNKPKSDFSIDQGKGFPNEESHHVVGIALVHMYGKCGQLTKAWHTFNIVQNRNVVLWTSLIGAYIEHGHDAKAFNCLKQMQAEGILPNPVWFICGLKAYGNMRAQDKGLETHGEIVKLGFDTDLFVGSALVDAFSKCLLLPEVQKVVDAFSKCLLLPETQKVVDALPCVNAFILTPLMISYAENGSGKEAVDCWKRMLKDGVHFDAVTLKCMPNVVCSQKHKKCSRSFLSRMCTSIEAEKYLHFV